MYRLFSLCFVALLLISSGCKIEITVPPGGDVASVSGAHYCGTGETCTIDVKDTFFNEEFIARPDNGHIFTHWVRKPRAFCGDGTTACLLATTAFGNSGLLLSILDSDEVYYLEPVFREPDSYVSKSEMLIGGASRATCAVKGRLYVFGAGWETESPLNTTQEYDPLTDRWTQRANMPSSRSWATATSLKGKCYVIGGSPGGGVLSQVEVYDPSADSWQSAAPMPEGRFAASSAAVDGKLYVIGGGGDFLRSHAQVYPDVFIYDPGTDTWTTGEELPTPRKRMGIGVVNGLIYTIGGDNPLGGVFESDIVESYNPRTNQWASRAPLPTQAASPAVSALGGRIYVFGGFNSNPSATAASYRYDPAANQWQAISHMSQARGDISSERIGGQIYIVGGRAPDHNGVAFRLTESYAPSAD